MKSFTLFVEDREEERRFWKTIEARPADPASYLVYADWLEERGEPFANLIRGLYEAGVQNKPVPNGMKLLGDYYKLHDEKKDIIGTGIRNKVLPLPIQMTDTNREYYPLSDKTRKDATTAGLELYDVVGQGVATTLNSIANASPRMKEWPYEHILEVEQFWKDPVSSGYISLRGQGHVLEDIRYEFYNRGYTRL